jgi:hypothetical protein
MRTMIGIFVLIAALILGYGYWQVSSHGWLYVSLYDMSRKDDYGRIKNARMVFVDSEGKVLAQGKSDDRYGVVHVAHPEEGYCTEREQNAPFSREARQAWQKCFDRQSTWLMDWVRDVRYVELKFGDCRLDRIPVQVGENKGDWWLWWVPHPHIGGRPIASFNLSLKVNGADCKSISR